MRVTIAAANIRHTPLMRPWQVRHDVRLVRAVATVVAWSEIRTFYLPILLLLLRRTDGWRTRGRRREVPISLKHWRVLEVDTIRLHRGRVGAGPARYLLRVLAEPLDGSCSPVVFMATHLVAGAWNAKPKPWKRWRVMVWERSWARIARTIAADVDEGHTVVVAGDWNRLEVLPFVHGFRWLAAAGLNKIGLVAGDAPVEIIDRRVLHDEEVETDHGIPLLTLQFG